MLIVAKNLEVCGYVTRCDGERRESDHWIELKTAPSFRRPTLVVKVPPVPPHGKAISELYLRSVAGE
jgi:hypothetical protein